MILLLEPFSSFSLTYDPDGMDTVWNQTLPRVAVRVCSHKLETQMMLQGQLREALADQLRDFDELLANAVGSLFLASLIV